MAHPAVNTKVEKVADAIEDLAIQAAIGALHPDASAYERVRIARSAITDALRELLQPTLRVVS